jgi:ABC-2 type transport system permease protein
MRRPSGAPPPILSWGRIWNLFIKEMTETFRDWKMLSLTLTFAPFLVFVMYGYLRRTNPVYQVAVVNADTTGTRGREFLQALSRVRSPEGEEVLRARAVEADEAEGLLQDRGADVVIFLPEEFSRVLDRARAGGTDHPAAPLAIRSRGDPGNPDYLMAVVWADMTILGFAELVSGRIIPVVPAPETVSGASSLTDFDLYVPALLALALMMLMFTAAGALIREKDRGTIIRLRLSNLSVVEWLSAVTATQLLVGILALGLTYLAAWLVGYRSAGSLFLLLGVGALASLSIMAFSVLVAAFLRTVFDLVTVGCFPFFILMFFSGGMIPLPGLPLFQVGGRTLEVNEILPTTHAIAAMQKVLSYGVGLGAIRYEMGAMIALTLAFYALGTWAFTRRQMSAAR